MNNTIQLGLGQSPYPVYLFVGEAEDLNGHGCLWYQLDGGDKRLPVPDKWLAGYLRNIQITEKEFKGRKNLKLDLTIEADRTYVVRSGIDTQFSRGLLLALEQIGDFSSPLYFGVREGEQEKVVFSSLHTADGQKVKVEWDGNRPLIPIVAELRVRMGAEQAAQQPKPLNRQMILQRIRQLFKFATDNGIELPKGYLNPSPEERTSEELMVLGSEAKAFIEKKTKKQAAQA